MAERTRASELISNAPDSHGEIAAKLGVDKSLVTRWRSGTRTPSAGQLAELEDIYGAARGIDEAPPSSRPRLPEPPSFDEHADESNNERLGRFIREGMREIQLNVDLSGVKKAEAVKKLVDAQVALDRSTGDNALTLTRIVAHPEFRRCVKLIVDACTPYPEALRAVAAALKSTGA